MAQKELETQKSHLRIQDRDPITLEVGNVEQGQSKTVSRCTKKTAIATEGYSGDG